jgi:hypothetical protein
LQPSCRKFRCAARSSASLPYHGTSNWSRRKQFALGEDERFKTAPKEKPKEPPLAIQAGHTDLKMLLKHYLHSDHEAMRKALSG